MKQDLNTLAAFMAVAQERNFTRAAAQLGVSQSALSRTVRGLEDDMGMPLLVRTTRSVALTDAGERLLAAIEPSLTDIRTEVESLRAQADRPAGIVRITATDYAVNTCIWPRIQPLLRQYPDLHIEITEDYGMADIVTERYDIGVRGLDIIAQDMVAVRIAPDMTVAIVGAPDYLNAHPKIRKPQDLTAHHCIRFRLPTRNSLLSWELQKGKRKVQVRPGGQLIFNSVGKQVEAALAGFGLAYVPKDLVECHVKAKRLDWVLPDWFPTWPGLHMYYPSRRKPSRAVELVVEALKAGYQGK